MKSNWQLHVEKWKNGCGASICAGALKRVHARGTLPCDVLFVGEAPGESENVVGQPFVGPAGKLQDYIIERALATVRVCLGCNHTHYVECPTCGSNPERTVTFALCNLVGCIPRNEDFKKAGEPDAECIEQCAPRLQELMELAQARLIVCVGKLAVQWLKPGYKNPATPPGSPRVVEVMHPAFILRQHLAQRSLLIQRAVSTITGAVEDL